MHHSQFIRENPEWTNAAIFRSWAAMEREVGPAMMPVLTERTAKKIKAVEYGSGAYGTVIPTQTKGWVLKITSDPSEAKFATIAMKIGKWPSGIVKYKKVFHITGTHDGNPIFALWRQEAEHVGNAVNGYPRRLLEDYYDSAQGPYSYVYRYGRKDLKVIKSGVKPRKGILGKLKDRFSLYSDLEEAAISFSDAKEVAKELKRTTARSLGDAILFYIDRGMLMSDLHTGNIGLRGKTPVVTDPGVILFLDDRWNSVKPKELSKKVTVPRTVGVRRRKIRGKKRKRR